MDALEGWLGFNGHDNNFRREAVVSRNVNVPNLDSSLTAAWPTRNEDKPDPCEVSQNEGKQENQMKKLMFVLVLPILIAGCASPLRIQTTDLSGGVREIEVKNLSGEVIEVNDGFRKKLDERKAALEGEIKNVLEGKVKNGDFKKDYSIPVEGIVAKGGKEPLTEEEMGVFRAVGETLTREYVKQIIYPA